MPCHALHELQDKGTSPQPHQMGCSTLANTHTLDIVIQQATACSSAGCADSSTYTMGLSPLSERRVLTNIRTHALLWTASTLGSGIAGAIVLQREWNRNCQQQRAMHCWLPTYCKPQKKYSRSACLQDCRKTSTTSSWQPDCGILTATAPHSHCV